MEKAKAMLPGVEFEGSLGQFWPMDEVPIEAIAKAIKELFEEAERRGFNEEAMIELIKRETIRG